MPPTNNRVMEDPKSGLNAVEAMVAEGLVLAWNAFCELPDVEADDLTDFRHAINTAQRILQSRIVAREHPSAWQ